MVEAEQIVGYGMAASAVVGAFVAWVKTRNDMRRGVSEDQRTARRDTIADRDILIDQLQEQIKSLFERVERLERDRRAADRYTDLLVEHIWEHKPPPPPPRPRGA